MKRLTKRLPSTGTLFYQARGVRRLLPGFLALALFFSACGSGDNLPVEHARNQIQDHLEQARYQDILEVVEIEFADNRLDRFNENEFMDMLFHVTIRVKEPWVMSRAFMPYGFEINQGWPETRQSRLDSAPDDQVREQVEDFYNHRAFSGGEHTIKSLVTYGRLDNRWVFVEFSMDGSLD